MMRPFLIGCAIGAVVLLAWYGVLFLIAGQERPAVRPDAVHEMEGGDPYLK